MDQKQYICNKLNNKVCERVYTPCPFIALLSRISLTFRVSVTGNCSYDGDFKWEKYDSQFVTTYIFLCLPDYFFYLPVIDTIWAAPTNFIIFCVFK